MNKSSTYKPINIISFKYQVDAMRLWKDFLKGHSFQYTMLKYTICKLFYKIQDVELYNLSNRALLQSSR